MDHMKGAPPMSVSHAQPSMRTPQPCIHTCICSNRNAWLGMGGWGWEGGDNHTCICLNRNAAHEQHAVMLVYTHARQDRRDRRCQYVYI